MSKVVVESPNKKLNATIDAGELVSFICNSEEIMHQKGNPGWRNVDTEMFPIIGATSPNNFKVSTPRGTCIQDQHGLLRELKYDLIDQTKNSLTFRKTYLKNTAVKNSKFPDKSTEKIVSWPYNFEFIKNFELTNETLKVSFIVNAEKGMPYMLGYHPAFKLNGGKKEIVITESFEISIDDILNIGASAFPVLNTQMIHLIKDSNLNVKIDLKGFENFMLWTEVDNMLCMEPITYYPNASSDCLTVEMFNAANGQEKFEVCITPYS
ncbi:aldose 1-epimerase [Urechidicola vernalis]|uniref:Aldose 1-epimerase n=1 Tax=Urechidicola vernalis TaxID=3075600 RepID=A0ABU2Y1Y2_9FLAO|nr:aldose 1-epimerase [Urechidicola sp. P050]MDT0552214.1 aldose 1-epimerase [Urechidicola sp. P050]